MWSTEDWRRPVATLAGHEQLVSACAWSQDGTVVVTASGAWVLDGLDVVVADCTVRVWSATDWKCTHVLNGHTQPLCACTFAPNGTLATFSEDGTAKLWAAALNWSCLETLNHVDYGDSGVAVEDVAWAPDGSTLSAKMVLYSEEGLRVWNLGDKDMSCPNQQLQRACFELFSWAPDSSAMVTVTAEWRGAKAGILEVWSPANWNLPVFTFEANPVQTCAWAPDSSALVTFSTERIQENGNCGWRSGGVWVGSVMRWWSTRDWRCVRRLITHATKPVVGCAFAPNGCSLVTVAKDYTLCVYSDV